MTLMAGVLAVCAAILGSALWAGITYLTGYQIGWMAIGLGAMIGAGARLGGGEGKVTALFCGGLALVAMFFGEVRATRIALDQVIDEMLTREAYEHEFAMADEFVLYATDDNYKTFVFENTYYSEATSPEEVTDAEVQEFLADYAPDLRRLHTERPGFETWRNRKRAEVEAAIMEGESMAGFVVENMGVVGVIFVLLGLFAAMRVVGEWD